MTLINSYGLSVLQTMDETKIPFASYLVNVDRQVRTPAFLEARNAEFDFTPLLRCNKPNEKVRYLWADLFYVRTYHTHVQLTFGLNISV